MVKKVIVDLDFKKLYCINMVTRNISSYFVGVKENLGSSLYIVNELLHSKKIISFRL